MWTLLAAFLLSPHSDSERNYRCWADDAAAGSPCWAEIRALYAAPPIEQLQRQGVQVRRIYFLDLVGRIVRDGRGHDMQAGMISIERAPGAAPRLIYYPARRQDLVVTPVAATISATDWDDVIARTDGVSGWTVNEAEICLHGWDLLVEAVDPGPGAPGQVARRHERSCYGGRVWLFADMVGRLAVGAARQCGTPPEDNLWFQIEWLHRCGLRPGTPA